MPETNGHERGPQGPKTTHEMKVFGRQGSPTITLALPFSRVDVKADDASPLVAELAALTARLARAAADTALPDTSKAEFIAIADAADALASAAHDQREKS